MTRRYVWLTLPADTSTDTYSIASVPPTGTCVGAFKLAPCISMHTRLRVCVCVCVCVCVYVTQMTEKDTKLKIAEVRAQRLEGLVRELQDKLHHANTELDTYRNTQRPASGSGNSTTRRLSSSDGTGAGAGRGARGAADHAAKHPVASDRHVDGFGHLAVSDSDVAARQEQLQGLLSEIRKAEGQLAAVQSQLKADQAASAAQQAELQSVHRELTTARSTLRDLQRQIEGVQSSLSSTAVSLRREQDRLDAVKRQCSDEAVHWEQRLEQLRSEAAELQQQRQQAAQSGQSGQGAGGSNEVSRLRQEVERLQGDLDRERENQETMLHELNQVRLVTGVCVCMACTLCSCKQQPVRVHVVLVHS